MRMRTARYKLRPSRAQYAALRTARFHCMRLRNACLQELIDSYRCACRYAAKAGRTKPASQDWIAARAEEISEFLGWQTAHESDLRRRHGQAEERRIAKLRDQIAAGKSGLDPADLAARPWRAKTATDFGRAISKQDQMRQLAAIRDADPDGIGALPRSILAEQIDTVHKAMDAFFSRVSKGQKPGFPRFKGFDRIRSIAAPIGDGIALRAMSNGETRLSAPMVFHGLIPMHMHRDLPGKPKAIHLTYDGRFWWATITCEVAETITSHPLPDSQIGVDAGIRRLLTFDDGSGVENPTFLKAGAPDLRRRQRKLARCKRASHGRRKAVRALAAAHRRLANRRRTHHHKVSKDLVARAETIFVEDLRLASMTRSAAGNIEEPGTNVRQKAGLNRGLLDASISTLYAMTRYKAESAGGRVIAVDPRNTSRDCSECGGQEPGARREERYRCSCGADLDADHNAARNVLSRGRLSLRQAA